MRLESSFLTQANRHPERSAVIADGEWWTYARLHDRAAAVATTLAPAAGGRPQRVGVCMERGPEAYAAILASLLAGAAFVPVNPHHPADRIRQILDQADLCVVVADEVGMSALVEARGPDVDPAPVVAPTLTAGATALERAGAAGLTVFGADVLADILASETDASPWEMERRGDPTDEVAYLLFTSGSTGRPKGVPITHGNVGAFLDANADHHRLGPDDRCSQAFDLTFDLSVFDLFLAWRAGACLYPLRSGDLLDPVGFVNHHQLTLWFSVPSVASLAHQRRTLSAGAMPSLATSLFCGEALPVDVAGAWAEAAPASAVENLYGPTELTIACTRYRWHDHTPDEARLGVVPLGHPFDGLEAVVVDDDSQIVSAGAEGELCVAGPQRFTGYWRAPELSARRSLDRGGTSYYRTGDRVVADAGGCFHYVGRTDQQVQVQGNRVELGEVEAALRSLDDVVDAVAFALPLGATTITHLGAAVSVADGSTWTPRALRRAAAESLPPAMRPKWVEVVDQFPLNVNGKIDRATIAARLARTEAS